MLTAVQPVGNIYEIVVVPARTPETMPVAKPTVATVGSLLLHVPPAVAFANVIVWFAQTCDAPVIAESGLTVTTVVEKQPEPIV